MVRVIARKFLIISRRQGRQLIRGLLLDGLRRDWELLIHYKLLLKCLVLMHKNSYLRWCKSTDRWISGQKHGDCLWGFVAIIYRKCFIRHCAVKNLITKLSTDNIRVCHDLFSHSQGNNNARDMYICLFVVVVAIVVAAASIVWCIVCSEISFLSRLHFHSDFFWGGHALIMLIVYTEC